MTPELYLNVLADALALSPADESTTLYAIAFDGRISLTTTNPGPKNPHLICRVTPVQRYHGFSVATWASIRARIADLQEKGLLPCHTPAA